jgi:hypothetical protein
LGRDQGKKLLIPKRPRTGKASRSRISDDLADTADVVIVPVTDNDKFDLPADINS